MEKNGFKFSPLLRDSDMPLHQQLADQIREGVRMNAFNHEEALPKEMDIAKALGTSRSVVRQSILQLVAENLLYRLPRKGTFLAKPLVEHDLLGFYNFKNEVEQQGLELTIRLVSFQKLPMDPMNAGLFRVSETDRLVSIVRTLSVNNAPVLLERTTLPDSLVPEISIEDVRSSPFLTIFNKYGLTLTRAKKYIEPKIADPFVSKEIGISAGMPVLLIDRYTYGPSDNVVARCEWTIRGDRCRYYISLDNHNI